MNKHAWNFDNDSIRAVKKEKYGKLLEDLAGLDSLSMGAEDYINKELLILEMEMMLNDIDFEAHLLPLNAEGGFLAGIIYSLQYEKTGSQKEKKKYIEK